eukprot:scaffold4345_cov125-Cylindrotheca_fusiformis.AAC.3
MGLFSKKNKKKGSNHLIGDNESLLYEGDQESVPPQMGSISTASRRSKRRQQPQAYVDDSSLEDIDVPDNRVYTTVPPPAREAAFHGPPRFDWIDIETNAAIKIQSIHRRNMAMKELDEKGMSTSAIRNRRRRRKAASSAHPYSAAQTQDTPSIFSFCAMGLAFGDATEDGDDAYRKLEKKKYEERQKQQAAHEEALRRQYMSKHGINPGKIVEALEVVD